MHLLLISTDINECEMDNDCDEENGVCTNTNGSYLCSCKMGFRFSGIGFSCSGQLDVYFNIYNYSNNRPVSLLCCTINNVHFVCMFFTKSSYRY